MTTDSRPTYALIGDIALRLAIWSFAIWFLVGAIREYHGRVLGAHESTRAAVAELQDDQCVLLDILAWQNASNEEILRRIKELEEAYGDDGR